MKTVCKIPYDTCKHAHVDIDSARYKKFVDKRIKRLEKERNAREHPNLY